MKLAMMLPLLFLFAVTGHAQTDDTAAGVIPPVFLLLSDTSYNIGDEGPAGGVVFYTTGSGLHGLEAAPADQGAFTWGCYGTNVAGVDDIPDSATPDSNSGAVNTPLIVAACGVSPAAGAATAYVWPNGQTDGFLPNKEELNLLYLQRNVVGGFALSLYWSSSEYDASFAWHQSFFDGNPSANDKRGENRVRAVRAF